MTARATLFWKVIVAALLAFVRQRSQQLVRGDRFPFALVSLFSNNLKTRLFPTSSHSSYLRRNALRLESDEVCPGTGSVIGLMSGGY